MPLKVHISGLAMDSNTNSPVVLLKADADERVLPIWIGLMEATAIASALKHFEFERPMTHDLFRNVMRQLNAEIAEIEVCDIRENTYYAEIRFRTPDGPFSIDARPSDAIAMALRFDAPLFVQERVFEQSAAIQPAAQAEDTSDEGKKWEEYLKNLDPDEFGKYKV